jgi:outer membrane biogenesis lipoprotein LolB
VAVALLLSACATLSSAPDQSPAAVEPAQIARQYWLSGRLSVRVNDRLEIAKIVWERNAGGEHLQFFTPFGGQVADVVRAANGRVTLKQGEETREAESMGALTASLFGAALDTDEISRWIQMTGLADGAARDIALKDGTIWSVTAERPKLIGAYRIFERLSAIKGDTTVRLVIDEWQPR